MFNELRGKISRALSCKNFKEIKRLKSLQVKAEAYLEPMRASTMELFCVINGLVLFLQ